LLKQATKKQSKHLGSCYRLLIAQLKPEELKAAVNGVDLVLEQPKKSKIAVISMIFPRMNFGEVNSCAN